MLHMQAKGSSLIGAEELQYPLFSPNMYWKNIYSLYF